MFFKSYPQINVTLLTIMHIVFSTTLVQSHCPGGHLKSSLKNNDIEFKLTENKMMKTYMKI